MATRVLCVDDDVQVLRQLTDMLRPAGFDALVAESGYDALALAFSKKPDLILLDLILPDLSGEDVCRKLRAHAPTARIPIIMLTVKRDELAKVRGLETGADDYVTKPFSEQILLARIKALLRRKEITASRADIAEYP